jgi:hypothetical protein
LTFNFRFKLPSRLLNSRTPHAISESCFFVSRRLWVPLGSSTNSSLLGAFFQFSVSCCRISRSLHRCSSSCPGVCSPSLQVCNEPLASTVPSASAPSVPLPNFWVVTTSAIFWRPPCEGPSCFRRPSKREWTKHSVFSLRSSVLAGSSAGTREDFRRCAFWLSKTTWSHLSTASRRQGWGL